MDPWQMIDSERAALADGLEALPADAWDKPSLCDGWTIRQVVAHVVATATTTPPLFFGRMAASGFRFPKMVRTQIDRQTAANTDADLARAVRDTVGARTSPPGPVASWLGETIVHGEDVFGALGPFRPHPTGHLIAVADFYAGSNLLIGAKNRIAGVTLRATDTDWRHGDGPEAAGPMVALVLAMTGRRPAFDDLRGDGVAVLRSR